MKLSKQHKVYVSILALALAGLVVDRLFLGADQGGAEQAEATTADPLVVLAADTPFTSPIEPLPATEDSIAECLKNLYQEEYLDLTNLRDAFSPSQTWMAEAMSTNRPGSKQTPAEIFARNHVLEAVIVAGQGSYAVVDGKCFLIGDRVDGFRLISVSERSAVWESQGCRITLVLKSPI